MQSKIQQKELDFFQLYERFITANKSGKRVQPNGKKISEGTIANYVSLEKLLLKFCSDKNNRLRFRPVKRLQKRELIAEKNYWKKFYLKFTTYLSNDCKHFDNTIGQCIKNLKVFFNYCNKDLLLGIGEFHKEFYVRKEEISIIALLPEELNYFVYNQEYEASLTPRMRKVKDFFVFGCTVALRLSDLLLLNKSNLRTVNNHIYLVVRSKKVNADTTIRLPDYAIDILQRNNLKTGNLLPSFNKTNLNKYLKELVELAGFTQPFGKRRERMGKVKEIFKASGNNKKPYRFCDLVTTHTMRRTAITTMLCLGMPEMAVRKISGHSPMSKEFFRYVSLAQTYIDNETSKMFEKLKERERGSGLVNAAV